ncbi:hypothetical protein ACWGH2_29335 [Streptomyces sp. NPDC054871]
MTGGMSLEPSGHSEIDLLEDPPPAINPDERGQGAAVTTATNVQLSDEAGEWL